ncbi:LpqN/LpqT family lipoprotein [Mycolicibacterium sp. S2-37]|uniref:LpqN/LpqT family lipoprotein n=1 Tax=Mycolicibacterium sp. S2-37 TaxID=2810297 RepID=UPI001A950AAD|nr:LpqN/LpqT family lipoprotein [Mycolicibacterium sp. S2-37]MBO0679328.1 LpqN/LpqT family lipoprotein [Mycolicibacterium sp. S2-37]
MTTSLRAGPVAVLAAAVGLALAGCGSDTSGDAASETQTTSSEAASSTSATVSPTETSPAQAAGPQPTIADYIRENGIQQTPVTPGAPGAPRVDLPQLPGWEDAGPRTPEGAYSAIVFADPAMAQDPPMITTVMSKLTGTVDPAKIFEYAPGEIKNLPGYENMGDGKASELGGFEAYQVGGGYTRDGVNRMIAQKTVVIPAPDGAYLLQLKAEGTEDQIGPLLDATSAIDEQTVITP